MRAGGGLLAQFPAPLKSRGYRPPPKTKDRGAAPFRGAGNCATSHDAPAANDPPAAPQSSANNSAFFTENSSSVTSPAS